jgi:hypothetical protein
MKPTFRLHFLVLAFLALITLTAVPPAHATFHLMQIEQVIAGVDGNTTVQAIQLRMRLAFQDQLQESRLVAWDAAGLNPVVVATPDSPVLNNGSGVRVLIATSNFSTFTSPPAAPDFILDHLIPASYLAAGSLTFEDAAGTIVYWRLSWGGAGYTGSNLGSTTNDADGNFGPPFAGPLPSADLRAVRFNKAATALSTTNANDYNLTAAAAQFVNNNGDTYLVQSNPTGVPDLSGGPELLQNVPNPFNPTTSIDFNLSGPTRATLRIYDARGALVITLLDRDVPGGPRRVTWDGRDSQGRRVSSGVYFYRLTAGQFEKSRTMVLLK